MGIMVEFRNIGYWTGWGYKRFLRIRTEDEILLDTGRDTYLASAIEKYIIKKDFLWSGKRKLRKKLTERQFRLLKGMCELGSQNYHTFMKALEESWSQKKLIAKILWKVL